MTRKALTTATLFATANLIAATALALLGLAPLAIFPAIIVVYLILGAIYAAMQKDH